MAKLTTLGPAAGASPLAAAPLLRAENDWRRALPMLSSMSITLREPTAADALPLLTALSVDSLAEVVSHPPPPTQDGFASLFASLASKRAEGLEACWAIIPRDTGVAIGLIHVRALECGFTMVGATGAIGAEFQGTHIFEEAARLVLGCLFGSMQVHRVEFRADVRNARANGLLRKLGASREGVLRRARHRDGAFSDEVLWAIVACDWCLPADVVHPRVH